LGVDATQVYVIDLVAWTWEEVATKDGDARPAERYGHSATVVGEEAVWVFGGEDAKGTILPGDVFTFNLNTLSVRSAGWVAVGRSSFRSVPRGALPVRPRSPPSLACAKPQPTIPYGSSSFPEAFSRCATTTVPLST
jgi:hypothetical protein